MCDNCLLVAIVEVEKPQISALDLCTQFEEVLRNLLADFIILDWRRGIAKLTYSHHHLLLPRIVKTVEELMLINNPVIQG